ncbi:hypothetical protein D3C87_1718990 [compost metagenome]
MTANTPPMATEATPSRIGRSKAWLATTPIRAMTRPVRAAVSSNRTVKMVGSLLSCTARSRGRPARSRLKALSATHQEPLSNRMARPRTR